MLTYHFISPSNPVNPETFYLSECQRFREIVKSECGKRYAQSAFSLSFLLQRYNYFSILQVFNLLLFVISHNRQVSTIDTKTSNKSRLMCSILFLEQFYHFVLLVTIEKFYLSSFIRGLHLPFCQSKQSL